MWYNGAYPLILRKEALFVKPLHGARRAFALALVLLLTLGAFPDIAATLGQETAARIEQTDREPDALDHELYAELMMSLGKDWSSADSVPPELAEAYGTTAERLVQYLDWMEDQRARAVESGDMVWIPTKGGRKHHKSPDCSNMDEPKLVPKDHALSLEFDACKRCNP